MATLTGNEQFYNQGKGPSTATPAEIVAVVNPIVGAALDGSDLVFTKQDGTTVTITLP